MKNLNNNEDYEDIFSGRNIYSNSSRDIYSNTTEDVFSSSGKDKTIVKRKKIKKRKGLKVIALLICIVMLFGGAFYGYAYSIINNVTRTPLDEKDLGISTNDYREVKNIALLGLDTRSDDKSGRADANVIVTIDKKNKKIKLISIARDSYVQIEGRKNDKLTHAYAYGKSQLSVKTLNQNYGLEITDYVTINFFELARIIDYLGGVYLEVDQKEMFDLNGNVIPNTDFGDIPCELIKETGMQLLSGAQAVCYARIRKIDGDIERGNRQKEVLTAMFARIKEINPLKLPKLAEMVLKECETSLSTNNIISLGCWTLLNSPEFEQLSIPNDNVKGAGKTIKGVWYYVYDIKAAKTEIYDFIYEINYYSKEEKLKREQQQ